MINILSKKTEKMDKKRHEPPAWKWEEGVVYSTIRWAYYPKGWMDQQKLFNEEK